MRQSTRTIYGVCPNPGKTPTNTNVILSAILLPVLITSAKIGGTLVFKNGVGLNLGRKSWNKFELWAWVAEAL